MAMSVFWLGEIIIIIKLGTYSRGFSKSIGLIGHIHLYKGKHTPTHTIPYTEVMLSIKPVKLFILYNPTLVSLYIVFSVCTFCPKTME